MMWPWISVIVPVLLWLLWLLLSQLGGVSSWRESRLAWKRDREARLPTALDEHQIWQNEFHGRQMFVTCNPARKYTMTLTKGIMIGDEMCEGSYVVLGNQTDAEVRKMIDDNQLSLDPSTR
jgi:hypothetical protein